MDDIKAPVGRLVHPAFRTPLDGEAMQRSYEKTKRFYATQMMVDAIRVAYRPSFRNLLRSGVSHNTLYVAGVLAPRAKKRGVHYYTVDEGSNVSRKVFVETGTDYGMLTNP